jgi:hypothetical protein
VSDLGHLSKKTRERAYVLSRNARSINLPIGRARFNPAYDYMSYWLSTADQYAVIFATPEGYLAEIHGIDIRGFPTRDPFGVRNIRHFLQRLKKCGFQDALSEISEDEISSLGADVDLRGYIEGLED